MAQVVNLSDVTIVVEIRSTTADLQTMQHIQSDVSAALDAFASKGWVACVEDQQAIKTVLGKTLRTSIRKYAPIQDKPLRR